MVLKQHSEIDVQGKRYFEFGKYIFKLFNAQVWLTLFSSGRYLYILFIRGIVYSELLLHVVAFLALPSFIVVIISVALTLLFGHASDFYTNCCIVCGSNEICCILILTSTNKYRVHIQVHIVLIAAKSFCAK